MPTVAAGTIVAKRELPYARVLARSLADHHPEIPFVVLLADEVEACFDPAAEPFELLELSDLSIPNGERFRFYHERKPLSYAATPFLLAGLLERFEQAVFIKQESLVLGTIDPILAALDRSAIALTPHLLAPLEGPDATDRELNVLQSGVFNGGVVGVRRSDEARRFLAWWSDRVFDDCRHAIGEGMHYEQRWLDLVPAYFVDVCVVRAPGANVGHWNLPERLAEECGVFRFSGFNPDRPERVTLYSDRLSLDALGSTAELFGSYARALKEAGWDEARDWSYAYDRFDNGVPIPELARELYRALGEEVRRFGDPFSTGAASFYHWLNEPVSRTHRVTRLWNAVYLRRADVQEAFPEPLGDNHAGFLHWAANSGLDEHGIPAAFADADEWLQPG